jgi:hypothetical protein
LLLCTSRGLRRAGINVIASEAKQSRGKGVDDL